MEFLIRYVTNYTLMGKRMRIIKYIFLLSLWITENNVSISMLNLLNLYYHSKYLNFTLKMKHTSLLREKNFYVVNAKLKMIDC